MPKRQRNPHDRSWMPRISGTRESYHTTQIEHNPARPKRNAPIPMCDARMVPKGTLRLAGWRWRVLNDHRAGHRPCFSMREVVATRNLTGSGDACLRRPACRCSVGWSKRSHSGGLGPPATSAFVNPVSRGQGGPGISLWALQNPARMRRLSAQRIAVTSIGAIVRGISLPGQAL